MQPQRLLQVASLLLLSAAVLGQVETSAAMPSMAGLPAEVQPSAIRCWKDFGANCRWGAGCAATVDNCQLCEGATCAYCKAGYWRATDGSACTECPVGAFCGGKSGNPFLLDEAKWRCDWTKGVLTDGPGKWAASQCDTCAAGWGSFKDGKCTECEAGTAKKITSKKECDFCLDGLIANANKGATDCLDLTRTERRRRSRAMLGYSGDSKGYSGEGYSGEGYSGYYSGPDFETAANEACADFLEVPDGVADSAYYDADTNSCACPAMTVIKVTQPSLNEDGEVEISDPSCTDVCDSDTKAFSLMGDVEPGLTECVSCPPNSKASPDFARCLCNPGFVEARSGLTKTSGCSRAPSSSSASDDDVEDSWGSWSHKGGNKKGEYEPEEKTEYPSEEKTEYPSEEKTEYSSEEKTEYSSGKKTEYSSGKKTEYPSEEKTEYPSEEKTEYSSGKKTEYSSGKKTEYSSGKKTEYSSGN